MFFRNFNPQRHGRSERRGGGMAAADGWRRLGQEIKDFIAGVIKGNPIYNGFS